MSFSAQQLTENRRSCYVNRCVRERSPAVVIAMLARWLLPIVRSVRTTSSHSGTHLMQR